jgi:methyl-accepting chemotaxis protein
MARHWTFGQKVGGGFAIIVALTIGKSILAVDALRSVVQTKDQVLLVNAENVIDAQKAALARERAVSATRGFLLNKNERNLGEIRESREELRAAVARLRARATFAEEREALDKLERAEADYTAVADRLIALRKTDATMDAIARAFDETLVPKREAVMQAVDAVVTLERRLGDEAKEASTRVATAGSTRVIGMASLVAALAALIALWLTRSLGRQIGSAVGQVQSSSAELQASANQQATGAKEQATAMSEITTTIRELLATSRQIAESAQRVAQIAGQTAGAARSGDGTVQRANDSISGIRRQVDLIVTHMLELGKKSQQIGAVLEIVSELAEQTNILAINATIEAAGAGDAGKRFAVVADEIRKLADRVAGSTKEIRTLIEDVRSAVNTTVMTTETGSKSVDAGTKQFADVASALTQIAGLVATTTEAAREIELSTKQQATAVEQVNAAIGSVAQATKESETSSSQTLLTASQLAMLSSELLRLVHAPADA